MPYRFKKHYTVAEARALLPQVKMWLELLDRTRLKLERLDKRVHDMIGEGHDIGGDTVNQWATAVADLKDVMGEFQQREIQIKDLERGLIDFPALREGKEIFLCWEKDDADIEHWHDLDAGYSGREPLE